MKFRGPVITLLAVAALAAVLLVVNTRTATQTQPAAEVGGVGSVNPGRSAPARVPQAPGTPPPLPATPPGGAPAGPPPVTYQQVAYAGRTSGNEATVAIKVSNDTATAYLCDGKRTEAWLKGTVSGGQLTLQGANGATATGVVQGDAIFGTVRVLGIERPYAAQVATAPAGLYQGKGTVNGAPSRIGWIVRQDGSQVGIADIGGIRQPAPAFDPIQLRGVPINGSTIVPGPVSALDDVLASPSARGPSVRDGAHS